MLNRAKINKLFTSNGVWKDGVVLIRILAGVIIFNFGWEVFSNEKMSGYKDWLTDLHIPSSLLLLIFLHFFFTGPGKWSFDYLFFNKKKTTYQTSSIN